MSQMQLAPPQFNGGEMIEEGGNLLEEIMQAVEPSSMDPRESVFIDRQLSAAQRRPRSLKRFLDLATEYATVDEDTAASCSYSLPRDGKVISGVSIRLAEILAMAWGNIHTEARIVDIGDKFLTVAATCWDMQNNVRMGQEIRRRITTKTGKLYSDDMIITTANAGMSIALRNAILRVIPRAFAEIIRGKCLKIVKGDEKTLGARRMAMIQHLVKAGANEARILAAVGKHGVEDISLDDLVTLRGFATAIKEKTATIEQCFPDPSKSENHAAAIADKLKSQPPAPTGQAAPPKPAPTPPAPKQKPAPAPNPDADDPPATPQGQPDDLELERLDSVKRVREELDRCQMKEIWGTMKINKRSLNDATLDEATYLLEELRTRDASSKAR